MRKLTIGDITITSIIERDGPWRTPEEMFPAYDPAVGKRHLAELDPEVFDPASGKMVITYQTYVVRTPKHTMLIDTCTGEDKGYPPPMDFPKQPWLDGFRAAGLRFEDIDYVFCTHLHIDHTGWNTMLRNGKWVPTFPKAKYIFHKREYAAWEESNKRGENRPGRRRQCVGLQLRAGGRGRAGAVGRRRLCARRYVLADADAGPLAVPLLRQYPLARAACGRRRRPDASRPAIREPDWSTVFDWDQAQAARSRRKFLGDTAGTGKFVLPIHFPHPTTGLVEADGERFRYKFVR